MLYDEAVVVLVTRDGYSRKPDKGITREKGVMSGVALQKDGECSRPVGVGACGLPGSGLIGARLLAIRGFLHRPSPSPNDVHPETPMACPSHADDWIPLGVVVACGRGR